LALSVISLLRSDSVAFECEADIDRSNQSDVNDPTETWAAQDFRSAKSIIRSFAKAWYHPSIA
jgi:hypothetical protein